MDSKLLLLGPKAKGMYIAVPLLLTATFHWIIYH